jgi:ubiquinone/menaquinone biosynthesis C-methylase UbiE
VIGGLYGRYVLPRLIDLVMQTGPLEAERRRLVPRARGRVLEVGFGSGLNLPFYGRDVQHLAAVDPSSELWRLARPRLRDASFAVEFAHSSAERLPFEDAAFDTAVMTWTLCSIPQPDRALAEIRRVLRPAGTLLFIEHGRAPDARVQAWQDRLTPAWRAIAGGCHLNRPIGRLVSAAGFGLFEMDEGYGTGLRPFTYLYRGVASPSR